MRKISVMLADDQTLFVDSLKGVLELHHPEIQVVAIARNGREAVEIARSAVPDVILMDVRMPVLDGVKATRIIHQKHPDMHIIMLTTFDDDEYVQQAISHGAVGYVLKDMPVEDLVESIKLVHEGAFLVSSTVAPKIIRTFTLPQHRELDDASLPSWFQELTRREKEILFLMAAGCDNKEMASRLYLAEQTVRNHVGTIYAKLGVHDRPHAIRMIIEANIESLSSPGESRTH